MNIRTPENSEEKVATNVVAILGLVTEMARCINENIAKVQLQPLDAAFGGSHPNDADAPKMKVSKA